MKYHRQADGCALTSDHWEGNIRHTVTTQWGRGFRRILKRHTKKNVPDKNSLKPAWIKACDGVTDNKGGLRGGNHPMTVSRIGNRLHIGPV